MAGLSVRKLDNETPSRLPIRAAMHGVSMTEEARRILEDAVRTPERSGDLALGIFGSEHSVNRQLPDKIPHGPLDLAG